MTDLQLGAECPTKIVCVAIKKREYYIDYVVDIYVKVVRVQKNEKQDSIVAS